MANLAGEMARILKLDPTSGGRVKKIGSRNDMFCLIV